MANYTRYSKKKESKTQLANEFSWLSLKVPQTHIHKILKEGEGFCKPCGEGVYLIKDTLKNIEKLTNIKSRKNYQFKTKNNRPS